MIKFFLLICIFITSLYIGLLISQKYANRVKELKEMKSALNIFETKIKFTYASIPEIFEEISKQMDKSIGDLFRNGT